MPAELVQLVKVIDAEVAAVTPPAAVAGDDADAAAPAPPVSLLAKLEEKGSAPRAVATLRGSLSRFVVVLGAGNHTISRVVVAEGFAFAFAF